MPDNEPQSSRPTWVKIVVIVAVLWVGGLIVAAVGGYSGDADESPEDSYLEMVRENVPGAASKTDDELIAGGRDLCNELAGRTHDQVLGLAVVLGADPDEFAATLVAAVNSFCPEYSHLLE